jgi:hypothetical protein
MVSGIPPVGIPQNKRFLSCDTILLQVGYVLLIYIYISFYISFKYNCLMGLGWRSG